MKIGFIDFYLDEWHANNYPKMIHDASNGEIEVTYAYGMVDGPKGRRTNEQWCKDFGIERCFSIEELVEKSDGIIVLSPDNSEMHEGLCQIPLRSGKPCYIDKTFAPDYETAKRIFAVADAYGTPCYTSSALRFADEYQALDRSSIRSVTSWGPNGFDIYSIHQIEPLMMLMGVPVEKVLALPDKRMLTLLIVFTDGRTASVTCFYGGCPFTVNVSTDTGAQVLQIKSNFWSNFTVSLVDFFRTGDIKVPHEETLEVMRLRTAGFRALERPGEWIKA